ncbi:PREDICTED: inactive protein RESTRICTED TEV MOVEMENT 1-like [Tarenaya hassleriana]|uniref:inactive protein RESTRICTED TEV MOVEMENT 1-like n=1 Tax=Tarenaya hassleriana TaxID=28532 RepID=UPI00053C449C|nr:PREDICTED: inactive protein RESTRICTED TEV MOVEMENT 1-like [Tarenaya hassleriana]XP_010542769.1 PREDICTED: inactive protein RESTRICTED TEV MOVEMENT 1-like [Tarenaya hassleriana]
MDMEKKIKIGPTGTNDPDNHLLMNWDDGGRGDISYIFLSFNDTGIISIQFQYVKDGKPFLTDRYGSGYTADTFETIELKYPEEYLTRIGGEYSSELVQQYGSFKDPHVRMIKFSTNLAEYGPYGGRRGYSQKGFAFGLGKSPRQFGGFHGSYDSRGLHSIGVYLFPKTPWEESDITLG